MTYLAFTILKSNFEIWFSFHSANLYLLDSYLWFMLKNRKIYNDFTFLLEQKLKFLGNIRPYFLVPCEPQTE